MANICGSSKKCNESQVQEVAGPERTIRAEPNEQRCKRLHLKYYCLNDIYERPVIHKEDKGWRSLIWESKDAERKIDSQQKLAYFTTTPDAFHEGTIEWRFEAGAGYKFTVGLIKADNLVSNPSGGFLCEISFGPSKEEKSMEPTQAEDKKNYEVCIDCKGKPSINITAVFGSGDKSGEKPSSFQVFKGTSNAAKPSFEIELTIEKI